MHKGSFKIREDDDGEWRWREVEGYVNDTFGVRARSAAHDYYDTTHLRTGFRITMLARRSLDDALWMADELAVRLKWDGDDVHDIARANDMTRDELHKAILRIKLPPKNSR
jgi:hypothetical protein